MILKRSRCENRNSKIYPKISFWNAYLIGDIPSYCPNCGYEIIDAREKA